MIIKAMSFPTRSIITVIAETLEEGLAQIEDKLTRNPSRRAFYRQWIANGRLIELEFNAENYTGKNARVLFKVDGLEFDLTFTSGNTDKFKLVPIDDPANIDDKSTYRIEWADGGEIGTVFVDDTETWEAFDSAGSRLGFDKFEAAGKLICLLT